MVRAIDSHAVDAANNVYWMMYGWDSTDTKPTNQTTGLQIAEASVGLESDTGKKYLYSEAGGWKEWT